MKKISFSFILIFTVVVSSFAQGIIFETSTLAEAMDKAKRDNKIVFIDVYTTWCGPCKKMTLDVFTKENVGNLFNSNFVNYKIDAEKGEGVEFAKRHKIKGFPTMLWIDPKDDKVLHRIEGARGVDELLNEARILEKSAKAGGLERMKEKFNEGNNDPDFLLEFYSLFPEKENKMRPSIALRYLNAIDDKVLFDRENGEVIMRVGTMFEELDQYDKNLFYKLADGVKAIHDKEGKIGADYMAGVIFPAHQKIGKLIEKAIENNDEEGLEKLIEYKEYWPDGMVKNHDPDWDLVYGRGLFFASSDFLRLEFMRVNRQGDKFLTTIVPYMENIIETTPKGEWVTPHYDYKLLVNSLKGMQGKGVSTMYFRNLRSFRSRSIDYLTRFVDYYWRLAPTNKTTKANVGRWIDYIVAINPFYSKGTTNSTGLLLKTDNKKIAISNLEMVISEFESIHFGDTKEVNELRELLQDIKNDKAY